MDIDLDEIKKILAQLSEHDREQLFQNLRRINFNFKINKSFLKYPTHPITIPREFYPFLDIHKIQKKQDATIIFPDSSTAAAYIRYSRAGWGEYHQIRVRNPYSGIGISKLKVGDRVKVEIYKDGELTRIALSHLK